MDWTDTGYSYDIGVTVVSQTNVDNTLGSLSGVQPSSISITEEYYSDSRVSAKVTTTVKEGESDGYIENARLRIILTIPSENWFEELITGYVSDIDETNDHGYTTRKYSIEGTIWGLLEHKVNSPVTIGKGAKMVDVWTSLLRQLTKVQYNVDQAQDHSFGSAVVYEAGTDLSTILFEISSGYSRMDVDGHGRIILKKYTAPSKRTPEKLIDYNSLRGLAMTPLNLLAAKWEAPGRAIVTATISNTDDSGKSSQEVVVGSYDAPKSDPTSIEVRGWLRARQDSYSGTSENPSKSELDALAKKNWEESQDKGTSWECSSVFKNYHAGDIATLVPPTGLSPSSQIRSPKVLIQSVTTNIETMTQDLSLKEV